MSEPRIEDGERSVAKGPPSGYFLLVPPRDNDDAIGLADIVATVLGAWKLLAVVTFAAAVVTAIVSLQLRKVYRAEALIVPASHVGGGSTNGLGGQLGGLAALAGINLGASGNMKDEMLAILSSRGFARDFITRENLMPELFAERWDADAKRWKVGKSPPTLESAVDRFVTSVRNVSEDKKTGVVTVSVKWYSPELAARWANRMVDLINERARADAISSAEQSIAYLDQELNKTNVVGLQQAIYRLIEDQVQNKMLANVRHEYAFRFVDRAVPPETRVSPKRTVMVLVGAAIGFFVGLLFVFGRQMAQDSAKYTRKPA